MIENKKITRKTNVLRRHPYLMMEMATLLRQWRHGNRECKKGNS
jgi:hypothetical protein